MGSPFFCGIVTGTISASKKPASAPPRAFWLRGQRHAVLASRSIPNSAATFSAVSGIESTPYCSFISWLTKRQPMVVS